VTALGKDTSAGARLASILQQRSEDFLRTWIAAQPNTGPSLSRTELTSQCTEFLALLPAALASGTDSTQGAGWTPVRELLARLSRSRAQQGSAPSDTATFVFSIKEPFFTRLREAEGGNADLLASDMWTVTRLVDALGLYTTEVFVKGREEIIARQQRDMLELSTPVVTLWDGVLALPMIGTLDSARTQVVMETLLQRIVETGSELAIIDITGVPTVDTLTAQHLIKTVTAARLMGAECIISGIRPQIAQTIVHLGVNLGDVTTKATLADAFRVALARSGRTVVRA
jgi:rsbT co-antagonist protein RsbR